MNEWNGTEKRALLLLKRFITARQLAREVGVSRVNAYRILRSISAERKLQKKRVRQHDTGPLAFAYRLARS